MTRQLAWLLNIKVSLFCILLFSACWVLDRSRGLGALKLSLNTELGKSRKEEGCNEWAITWSREGVMVAKRKKRWKRMEKEKKGAERWKDDALHSSSSGVSNRLPMTDYPRRLRTTNINADWENKLINSQAVSKTKQDPSLWELTQSDQNRTLMCALVFSSVPLSLARQSEYCIRRSVCV